MSALFLEKRTSPRKLLQDKTLKFLVPNSKRLGGYTQMRVLFLKKKRYTPPEDLTKRYTVSLKKALGRRLFLLGKT